jgi:large subunit ribosomal protein L28
MDCQKRVYSDLSHPGNKLAVYFISSWFDLSFIVLVLHSKTVMMNRIFTVISTRMGKPRTTISQQYHHLSATSAKVGSPTTSLVTNTVSSWMPSIIDCFSCQQKQQQQQQQRRWRSNRSQRGLYDGKDVRSGNNVSFSMRSTKRKFKPNVFIKRVYSEILDEMIRFHVTTSALRSIDKMGGLDNYLLTSPHVVSGEGLQVKKRIINRLKYQQRHADGKKE